MLILALRTDKPEAELYLYEEYRQLAEVKWQAHRQLAETIHKKMDKLLDGKPLTAVEGIITFRGPGSFTGLRIGASVANALAYSLSIPIVSAGGKNWLKQGVKKLQDGVSERAVLPEYGRQPHTTKPKK